VWDFWRAHKELHSTTVPLFNSPVALQLVVTQKLSVSKILEVVSRPEIA
jgi:hypothetical protein